MSFQLKHAEWLLENIDQKNGDQRQAILDALSDVVDAAIKLQEQNPGYLYSIIYREVINLFNSAGRTALLGFMTTH